VRRRQIPLRGRTRKAQFVDALQTSDREDSATYRTWSDRREAQMKQEEQNRAEEEMSRQEMEKERQKGWELPINPSIQDEYDDNSRESSHDKVIHLHKELLKTRQLRMFASQYKEDATRKTFLDLPSEIRNMIYELALVENPQAATGSDKLHWELNIVRAEGKLQPWHHHFFRSSSYPHELVMATLLMLGAVNKQIRNEARSLFWAKSEFVIVTSGTFELVGVR
jgi:hypothetical protein